MHERRRQDGSGSRIFGGSFWQRRQCSFLVYSSSSSYPLPHPRQISSSSTSFIQEYSRRGYQTGKASGLMTNHICILAVHYSSKMDVISSSSSSSSKYLSKDLVENLPLSPVHNVYKTSALLCVFFVFFFLCTYPSSPRSIFSRSLVLFFIPESPLREISLSAMLADPGCVDK